MTKFLTKAALAATVAGTMFAAPAFAAPADVEDFIARATIVKPVTLANDTDLDFGTITMNPSIVAATVTVSNAPAAVAVCSDIVQLTCSGGGSADFRLSNGVPNQTITLTYGATTPTALTHSSGSGTVPFRLNAIPNVLLDSAGAGTFSVGGAIDIVTATADGVYTATVDVVANYL